MPQPRRTVVESSSAALMHGAGAESRIASGATAGYRGRIGHYAAIPHALANNATFQDGDVVITGATAPTWGYHSALERTPYRLDAP